jgi:biopolymer transport protein ExbD
MASKKNIPEINASSQADIAFTVLIFFLVVSTMDVDTGLMRTLPPMPDDKVKNLEDMKVKERNILKVRVNRANQIFVGLGSKKPEVMELEVLKDEAKKFVLNVSNDENLPEKKPTDIAMPDGSTWVYPVSSGIISLLCDADANYERYMEVQNELTRAFNEIRNEVSMNKFGKDFADLTKSESDAITKAVPMKISEAEEPKNTGKK